MKLNLLLSTVLVMLAISINSISAFNYEIAYYDNSVTGTTISTDPVSFYVVNTENITLYQKLGLVFNTSITSTYNADYESPFDNIYMTASGSLNTNKTCFNIGEAARNNITASFEVRNNIVHDGDSSVTYISTQNKYIIDTENEYMNISVFNNTDSENYVYNVFTLFEYRDAQITDNDIISKFEPDNFDICKQLSTYRTFYNKTKTGIPAIGYYYVIFNSTSGDVEWNVKSVQEMNPVYYSRGLIYKFTDGTIIETHNQTSAVSWTGTNSNLEENTLYVLALGAEFLAGATHYMVPSMSVKIDIQAPDYVCGEWGDCIEGYQYSECTDINEIFADKIETRLCEIIVLENATLGFEKFVRINDMYKCSPQWFFGTDYYLNTTFRDTPLNWTIGENDFAKRDFLKMTSEWATEGSRSLKMWYIPPKMAEVIVNATGYPIYCGNVTGGTLPYVYRNVSNTSFSVNFNVTFPGENMLLSFDVKGCEDQAQQHTSFSPLSWGNVSIIQYWPELCYAESCDTVPKSNYIFNILDTNTGASIIGTPKIATASIIRPDQISIDLSNLGIVPGVIYTLIFAVYPENLDDRTGNCVYFDSVRYERIAESFIDILGGSCQSVCIGNDFYEATQLSDGACSVRKINLGCAGTDIVEALDRGESICDGDVLIRLNPVTKLPERVDCEYGCEDARCLTEEEAVIDITVASLYAPHPMIQNILNEWYIPLDGNEIVWFFNSMFMYINYLAIGLGFGVSLVVRGNSTEPKDMYIPFIVVIMIILVSSTFGGFYPLEIGIPIIVFIGLLLWKTSERIVGGHGGG